MTDLPNLHQGFSGRALAQTVPAFTPARRAALGDRPVARGPLMKNGKSGEVLEHQPVAVQKVEAVMNGLTLSDNSPHRQAAIAFLARLLDPDGGLKVLGDMGQTPFVPACVPDPEMKMLLPASLHSLVEVHSGSSAH